MNLKKIKLKHLLILAVGLAGLYYFYTKNKKAKLLPYVPTPYNLIKPPETSRGLGPTRLENWDYPQEHWRNINITPQRGYYNAGEFIEAEGP